MSCLAGCAFVTFANRQCAMNAIKSMHHSQTMEVRTLSIIAGLHSWLAIMLTDCFEIFLLLKVHDMFLLMF